MLGAILSRIHRDLAGFLPVGRHHLGFAGYEGARHRDMAWHAARVAKMSAASAELPDPADRSHAQWLVARGPWIIDEMARLDEQLTAAQLPRLIIHGDYGLHNLVVRTLDRGTPVDFELARIEPQTRFGQNFLIDLNLVQLIAKTAELGPRDVVLEVGTGLGSLTTLLAQQAGHVVTVEIDRHLAAMARQEFEKFPNVTLLEQDALKSKSQLHPTVIETLQARVAAIGGGRLKLVANLPYNLATPILSNLFNL